MAALLCNLIGPGSTSSSGIESPDFTVATIVAPSAMKAEEEEAAAEGEVPTVGEEEAEGEGEAGTEGGEEA